MVDGYAGYDAVTQKHTNISAAGCLTHVRRKFADILKNKTVTCADSTYFIDQVAKLYHYEQEAKEMSDADRLSHRDEFSRPIVEKLETWIDERLNTALPNTALHKALRHAQSRWPAIKVI